MPILRNGIVIGVLVVQNRTRRHYTEEEEEALQTTAMVLAEIIASGELKEVARDVAADREVEGISRAEHRYRSWCWRSPG